MGVGDNPWEIEYYFMDAANNGVYSIMNTPAG